MHVYTGTFKHKAYISIRPGITKLQTHTFMIIKPHIKDPAITRPETKTMFV